jgi:hypothetical protein
MVLWRFFGIAEGLEVRGWPSFSSDRFSISSRTIDWSNWPMTKSLQVVLGQTAALQYHYGADVAKLRLMSAATILGRQSSKNYEGRTVNDFLYDIIHTGMMEEFRSFVHAGLQARAAAHYNDLAKTEVIDREDLQMRMKSVHDSLRKFNTQAYPFSFK